MRAINQRILKMAKKISNPAKKRAWDAFSRFIRVRDCIATTGLPFCGICITCDVQYHISYLDAGHCFAGRSNAGLFHEDLVNGQCRKCNQVYHGKPKKYRKIMEAKYGKAKVAKWKAECEKVKHNRDMDFAKIREHYKNETNIMLMAFGYSNYDEMIKGRDG